MTQWQKGVRKKRCNNDIAKRCMNVHNIAHTPAKRSLKQVSTIVLEQHGNRHWRCPSARNDNNIKAGRSPPPRKGVKVAIEIGNCWAISFP